MKRGNSLPRLTAIAACAIAVTAANEIQLLPAGEFRAVDGRPKDATTWKIDAEIAASIIADFEARENRAVIDYEHQTLLAADNGQPAPAAGWFKKLEWREGDGLYAVDVEWTERARAFIDGKEYLYISPVFTYDKKTGAVVKLLHAALTNNPALDGMTEAAVQAASSLINQPETLTMDIEELLKQLRWMFNLPTLATAEEILAEVNKAAELIKQESPEAAAANFDLVGHLTSQKSAIAALTAQVAQPDPAKFVSIEMFEDVKGQLTALTKQVNDDQVEALVTAALSDGRLLPAQEDWARSLGGKDLAALTQYLDTAQPLDALGNTQTNGGNPPKGGANAGKLNDSQLAVCKQLGISPEDYQQTLQEEANA